MVKPFGVMCPMFNYFGQLQNIAMDDRSHMDGLKKVYLQRKLLLENFSILKNNINFAKVDQVW